MAGIGAISDGYRRVASHRPQRGGHVSFLLFHNTSPVLEQWLSMLLQ